MEIVEFLDKHSSALFVLMGALLTHLVNMISKNYERKWQIEDKKVDWHRNFKEKILIEPIISFLDSEMKLISKIYAQGFEKGDSSFFYDDGNVSKSHISKIGEIGARISAFKDDNLHNKFNEFTRKRLKVGNHLFADHSKKDINKAYEELKEAEKLVGDILKKLQPDIPASFTK